MRQPSCYSELDACPPRCCLLQSQPSISVSHALHSKTVADNLNSRFSLWHMDLAWDFVALRLLLDNGIFSNVFYPARTSTQTRAVQDESHLVSLNHLLLQLCFSALQL